MHKRIHGKTIHRSLAEAQTKEQAEAIERRILEQSADRAWNFRDKNTTFEQFVDAVYTPYVHQHNKNIYVKEIFIKELKAHFGKMVLSEIVEKDCMQYRYKRLKTPLRYKGQRSNASVNKEMSTLSKIFTLAERNKLIRENPMRFVGKLREAAPRTNTLSRQQIADFLTVTETDPVIKGMFLLAISLPIRKAQILAITPEDVHGDWLSVVESKGKPARRVPLNGTAKRALEELTEQGLLPFPIKYVQKRWRKALIDAGINSEEGTRQTNFHFHDLRRVFGSAMMEIVENPYLVKELFNHSDMETSAIYVKTEQDQLLDAVNKLDWVN